MKRILLLMILSVCGAATLSAQANISRYQGTCFQVSVEGDRGYGAGISAGFGRMFGNGFGLSAGLGGEWNQRPNNGNNFFVTGFGEARYSLLDGPVSPFVAARVKLRYMIPHHLTEGGELGEFYSTATQFDIFGLGLIGLDFNRFSVWGGLGGGPSLFSEERKDPNTMKIGTTSETFMDLSYNLGFTFWF